MRSTLLALAAGLTLATAGGIAQAQCVVSPDMTGVWRGNDTGAYYVRQVGSTIWWVGMSPDNGRAFTNVFNGVRDGDVVRGTWADVPQGRGASSGTLTLRLTGGANVLGFEVIQMSGGFSGNRWSRPPCGDAGKGE